MGYSMRKASATTVGATKTYGRARRRIRARRARVAPRETMAPASPFMPKSGSPRCAPGGSPRPPPGSRGTSSSLRVLRDDLVPLGGGEVHGLLDRLPLGGRFLDLLVEDAVEVDRLRQ